MLTETPTNGRSVARLAGVALAALAAALLMPRIAAAGCGPRPLLPSDAHAAHQQQPAPERPAPCHGPHCSGSPERAPTAPAPSAPTAADQYACLCPFPAPPGGEGGARVREPASSAPAGHSDPVERPPRR